MSGRTAMYIAMEYRVQEVIEKNHRRYFDGRTNSGYFSYVWSVHPLSDRVGNPKGKIQVIPFSDNQTVIEGVAELLPLPKLLLPINFLISQCRLLLLLARLIRRERINVIVTTEPFYSGLLGLILKTVTGRPLVVRIGANYEEIYRATKDLALPKLIPSYRVQTWLGRFVLRRADLVSGNNQNNLSWALAHGARCHTAILPISSLIERHHLTPPEQRTGGKAVFRRLGIPWGSPALLCVSRLVENKHPHDAIRAMAYVLGREQSAVGIMAGAGPMLAELRALAASLGVENRIHFVGQTSQSDLFEIIPHCLTLSPVTGLALIETSLGGSPVVGFDRDWQGEFIQDGVNGFLVGDGDWQAMGARALRIWRDPVLARQFSARIRERALLQVDEERVRQLEKAAFDKVLGAAA